MDMTVTWAAVGAVGSVAAAGVAAWAAWLSRASAREANAAAGALATIERARRYEELTPRFRVSTQNLQPGTGPARAGTFSLRLQVALTGPPGLSHLDGLTVRIRNEGQLLAAGPTREQIRAQIWGPWMFTPGTGPDEARADSTGRVTEYREQLVVGQELSFQLEPTMRPTWATSTTQEDWQREPGTVLRLAIDARHAEHGEWTLVCEIDTGTGEPVTVVIP
jgi:hypothetical protein